MRLILILHGQTPTNVLGLLDTAVPGPPLTDLGLEQAVSLVAAWPMRRSTPLSRRRNSARSRRRRRWPVTGSCRSECSTGCARSLPVTGKWPLTSRPPAATSGCSGNGPAANWNRLPPGSNGESGWSVLQRYDQAINTAFADGAETVVAVSHGAAIRFWAGLRAANLPDDFGVDSPVHNTGVIVLVRNGSDDAWWAESWTGAAIGGDRLDDTAGDGPAAEPG